MITMSVVCVVPTMAGVCVVAAVVRGLLRRCGGGLVMVVVRGCLRRTAGAGAIAGGLSTSCRWMVVVVGHGVTSSGGGAGVGWKVRSRRLLLTTKTLEKAMAAPAIIGLSRPSAASGMAATL